MVLKYVALDKDENRTVHCVMRKELNISATFMRRLKFAGAISVSGISAYTNHKLSPGEIVRIDIAVAEHPCDNLPENGEVEVLFENEGLLAVNKPSGILVHPSRSRYTGTLSNFVAGYLLRGNQNGGSQAPETRSDEPISCPHACHAVNRLDRDTSGVVLFAKNSYMKSIAAEALSASDARKEYLALVCGEMPLSGTIDVPIRRMEERNMLRIPSPDGQRAVTHYKTLCTSKSGEHTYSLVKFILETGRTHQLRVHSLHLNHPILGDKLYNNNESIAASQALGIETQALHAKFLTFKEWLSQKIIEISAPWGLQKYTCNLAPDMLTYLG